jgi:glycosyltransferase involved in cell wall biosynthesis
MPGFRETVGVSIVIPVRNPGVHFSSALESLTQQSSEESWEVIVVQNERSDAASKIASAFLGRLPLRVISANERTGPSYARNAGALAAAGDKFLFVDADDEVAPGYVAAMSAALDSHAFVTSRVDSVSLNPEWVRDSHGPPWQQNEIVTFFNFMPGTGNNIGLRREVFERVGPFPEDFVASEDIAFSWRYQLTTGDTIHLVRDALYRYRYRESLQALYIQGRKWGASNVLLYRQFRHLGMPGRTMREAQTEWTEIVLGLVKARTKRDMAACAVRLGYCVGRLIGSAKYRMVYL